MLLLHGQHQPLGRIQPQLAQFFTEHFLQGREPTDANITVSHNVLDVMMYFTHTYDREGGFSFHSSVRSV